MNLDLKDKKSKIIVYCIFSDANNEDMQVLIIQHITIFLGIIGGKSIILWALKNGLSVGPL